MFVCRVPQTDTQCRLCGPCNRCAMPASINASIAAAVIVAPSRVGPALIMASPLYVCKYLFVYLTVSLFIYNVNGFIHIYAKYFFPVPTGRAGVPLFYVSRVRDVTPVSTLKKQTLNGFRPINIVSRRKNEFFLKQYQYKAKAQLHFAYLCV